MRFYDKSVRDISNADGGVVWTLDRHQEYSRFLGMISLAAVQTNTVFHILRRPMMR